MPTPVKHGPPAAATPPVKPGRGAPGDGAGVDSFRDELVRRRGADAARADKPQAAEAEAKRVTKPQKSVRGNRGRRGAVGEEEPAVFAEGAGEAEAKRADAPVQSAEGGEVSEPSAVDETSADETAAESQEGTEASAAAAAAASLVAAPAATPEAVDAGESPDGEVAEEDAALPAAGRVPARATVYHAGDVSGFDDAGATEGEAPAGTADATSEFHGLFAEGSEARGQDGSAEGGDEHQPGESNGGARGYAVPVDASAGGDAETLPEFEARATAADAAPRAAATVNPDVFSDAATAGVGEMKPEARLAGAGPAAGPAAVPLPPEARFAAANHEAIVTSMRGELMPNGGSMRIRLDPPQLGAMQVTVHIVDGVVTASFETSNDEATRLLGHSLNQLKSVLESHGVAVDKLQVQQAPREALAQPAHDEGGREQGGQSQEQEQNARQEQQRREMLKRMWRRLSGGQDPLDLTA